jgi:hypothetical protein
MFAVGLCHLPMVQFPQQALRRTAGLYSNRVPLFKDIGVFLTTAARDAVNPLLFFHYDI